MSTVGDRIKEMRSRIGISQNKLAKMAGISQSALSSIENSTKNPSVSTIRLLADALGCSLADIAADDQNAEVLTDEELQFRSMYSKLSYEEKRRVLDFMSGIASSDKKRPE